MPCKKISLLLLILLISGATKAEVTLPRLFTQGMVLQRNQNIPLWGWAEAGEQITIQFKEQLKKTTADREGKWKLELQPELAGGPYQLTIKGKNTIVIDDVLVGDVWLCSGQSNMEFPVAITMNAATEIKEANYPMIRQFKVPVRTSLQPLVDLKGGSWATCSPATVAGFTAVGYFFGRELNKELNVPIGLINASCGGTIIETWISKTAFKNSSIFKEMISHLPTETVDEINTRHLNAMMHKIDSVQGGLPKENDFSNWMQPATDDSNWPMMNEPGIWETKGWPELDGKVWFRKEINITNVPGIDEATLELGAIDDNDIAYVNGVKVGGTKGNLLQPRKYKIPASVLKNNKNVVAVEIEDMIGGGGFISDSSLLKINLGTSAISLAGPWRYKIESVAKTGFSVYPDDYPTLLYNGMISPLEPYKIKGVIWYQGESNADHAFEYRSTFPLLINEWRKQWGEGNFPFLFVQLASFKANTDNMNGSTWAELREAQTTALKLPNTGMAVTTDLGNPLDIHPKNKQDVGKRLAAIALHQVYGKANAYEGPAFTSMKISTNKIILSFRNVAKGLLIKDKSGDARGFKIAGADKQFHYARALVDGNKIIVYNDSVANPVAIRYAWADSPDDANVYNAGGFPLIPFRTDSWPALTKGVQYHIRNE